jgi:gamma-glutamylcyclotransferase (GGCT)/AIG2-like uncharacterized protein YtfP
MRGFARPGWKRVDLPLSPLGHGYIWADLYDLGPYPAAIPSTHSRVRGEVHRMLDPSTTLRTLDEIENYRPDEQDASLYVRQESPVTLDDGFIVNAWVYFYNRRLGRAPRIESGDYLGYLKVKR